MKHTPGPWEVRYYAISNKWSIITDKKDIGIIFGSEYEDEANANLIAAAPDLLDACKAAPLFTKNMNKEQFINAYLSWQRTYQKPAIAKAEGREEYENL